MFKKAGNKKIIIAAAVILAAAGVCIIMFGKFVSIRGQHLNMFRYSTGGGMTGGYHTETVKRMNGQALIRIETAEWHAQDPAVTEYLTDAAVLDELEAVVRKYRMNFWNGKRFTRMFVHDGESISYRFDFDDADISFSSQIYPMRYRNKLAELDHIIEKYIENGEKLSAPVNPEG